MGPVRIPRCPMGRLPVSSAGPLRVKSISPADMNCVLDALPPSIVRGVDALNPPPLTRTDAPHGSHPPPGSRFLIDRFPPTVTDPATAVTAYGLFPRSIHGL